MKKIIILFICILHIPILVYSESNSSVDSLKFLLKNASAQPKIDLLNSLSWELKYENTSDAFKFANEALLSAEKLSYTKGKLNASKNLAALNHLVNNGKAALKYSNQGIAYASALKDTFTLAKLYNIKALVLEDQSAYSEAILLFNKSYELFDKIGDNTEKTGILNNLAVLYGKINEKNFELKMYLKVIGIEENVGNKLGLARTYNNLAGVYSSMGDQKSSMSLYRKSLEYSIQVNSVRYEAAALNGIGLQFRETKQYDSAITYFEKAIILNRKNGYVQWLANNYTNLGILYLQELSDAQKGKTYIQNAASIYHSINDWNNYLITLNLLSEEYMKGGNYKEASNLLQLSEKYSDSLGNCDAKKDFFFLKYKSYKNSGNIKAALRYLELSKSVEDSLEVQMQVQQSYELQAKYDLTQQQQENEKLWIQSQLKEETILNQKMVIGGIIIIIILLIIIVFLAYRSKRKIRKANKALYDVGQQILLKASALQLANESKDKFLAIISHDLKNPISAITGLSDLLLDPQLELTDEDKQKYIKYINEGCVSADLLLENLMKWARSQTGKMELKPTPFDLAEPVKNAIDLVQNAAMRKEIVITSTMPEGIKIIADHEMISTCLNNLLSNAVKFTPVKGTIEIIHEINGKSASISIADSGVGISPDNMEKLFRLDTKSGTLGTENEKGTGLGLLLVKEFIEKNNGSISVQSTQGKGSTFKITLPLNGN